MTNHASSRRVPVMSMRLQRKLLRVSGETLVNVRPYSKDQALPFVVEPVVAGMDLTEWAASNGELLNAALVSHGALLLRGFARRDVTGFEHFVKATGDLLEYKNRSTPRTRVNGRIFTSTEYPSDETIPLHNELSYTKKWPNRLFFFCEIAPSRGGETSIADSREVFSLIPPAVREHFMTKGVLYLRNYRQGLDLSWQDAFQTSDPAEVDRYCSETDTATEWRFDGTLRTVHVCQATTIHPVTGECVWFNQAHLFHVSALPPEVCEVLESQFLLEDLPRTACYGDGSAIATTELEAIREAYRQAEIVFRWEENDILMLDNVLIAHGRRPFSGPRRILVGMT